MERVLYLNLKGVYFDAIKSGVKKYEFRECSKWAKKLDGREYDLICIMKGYPKKTDMSRRFYCKWKGCFQTVLKSHPHFNNHDTKVFAINVSEIVEENNG